MGDLGGDGLFWALIPVVIIGAIVARAIVVTRRRRGSGFAAGPAKDEHVGAFDLGRPPMSGEQFGPGRGL